MGVALDRDGPVLDLDRDEGRDQSPERSGSADRPADRRARRRSTLTDGAGATSPRPDSLWIQGGTPTDPILDQAYPGQYGFAALRCAVDNLNGDNVEWIAYPTGASHVFCYAYYIKPPPTSGTIIVRKVVSSPAGATQTFPFGATSRSTRTTVRARRAQRCAGVDDLLPGRDSAGRSAVGLHRSVPPGWSLTEHRLHLADGQEHDDHRRRRRRRRP